MAQELDEDGEPTGPELEVTPPPEVWGRVAAQTMKQVMSQRIREAEREMKYEEYAGREGDIVTGIIQQSDSRYTLLDLGRVEALLPQAEQVPYERPEPNARVKAYIVEVRKTAKGPQIVVSRTHPGLIKRLFELEVPEIHNGTVEIKAIAREAGSRSKVAVWSRQDGLDPVGATVGQRGARVQAVVAELAGEKIDVIPWNDDPAVFVANALSPAQVLDVQIDEEHRIASVTVPERMLSLAIGREGQNARLAAKLTGWRIDIRSDVSVAEAAKVAEEAIVQAAADALAAEAAVAAEAVPAVKATPKPRAKKAAVEPETFEAVAGVAAETPAAKSSTKAPAKPAAKPAAKAAEKPAAKAAEKPAAKAAAKPATKAASKKSTGEVAS